MTDSDDLVKRVREAKTQVLPCHHKYCEWPECECRPHINPNGPEAADRIEQLEREKAELADDLDAMTEYALVDPGALHVKSWKSVAEENDTEADTLARAVQGYVMRFGDMRLADLMPEFSEAITIAKRRVTGDDTAK